MRIIYEYDKMNDELWDAYKSKSDLLFNDEELNELLNKESHTQPSIDLIWNAIVRLIKESAHNIIPTRKSSTKINKPTTNGRLIPAPFYVHLRRLQKMKHMCNQLMNNDIPIEKLNKFARYIDYMKKHFPEINLTIPSNHRFTNDFLLQIKDAWLAIKKACKVNYDENRLKKINESINQRASMIKNNQKRLLNSLLNRHNHTKNP